MQKLDIYDTTLRDGCQAEGVAFSVDDKLRIARRLDMLGVSYIEGGWPNRTNPSDREFFQRAADMEWENAKIAAFGSTRMAKNSAEDDDILAELIAANSSVVTIFGKTWDMHATQVLRVSLQENIEIIRSSVEYLAGIDHVDEVIFDAEHFFDGYKADAGFAMNCLRAAHEAGADALVLCDTNGGSLPAEVQEMTAAVESEFPDAVIGIHCHNDNGLAVANSMAAVAEGATHAQGTINGYGERCGNADICTMIPNFELKMGMQCLPEGHIKDLKDLAGFTDEVANLPHNDRAPYVGRSAFAHKGGMHVNAVLKEPRSFEHIDPAEVGNTRRILVSDYSGTSTVAHKLQNIWEEIDREDPLVAEVLGEIKHLERDGYEFEAADASFELLARRIKEGIEPPFDLHGYSVTVSKRREDEEPYSEATIKVSVDDNGNGEGQEVHTAAEGTGPVHALDNALRKALGELFPKLHQLSLTDYKVRVLRGDEGTSAAVRVLVQTSNGEESWGTVGVHENIIEASWQAVIDSIIYGLMKNGDV